MISRRTGFSASAELLVTDATATSQLNSVKALTQCFYISNSFHKVQSVVKVIL